MFRTNELPNAPKETINLLLQAAGAGDCLASLPAIKYILDNYKYVNLLIWVPDYLKAFVKHVLPEGAIVRNYTEAKTKYNDSLTAVANDWGRNTAMRMHPTDFAYFMFLDKTVTIDNKNYLSIRPDEIDISSFNLPSKYVCINVGSTAKPKEMPVNIINDISTYCLSMGYMPVYLGKKETLVGYPGKVLGAHIADIDFSKGINLTDKTDLLQCAAIISGAKCLIGMEGGLTHLAAFTNTHIIAGYTFVNPSVMAPIRNNVIGDNMTIITPPISLGCRFCQSNMSFVYNHDFRNCFYSDYKCVTMLKSSQFLEALEKIL